MSKPALGRGLGALLGGGKPKPMPTSVPDIGSGSGGAALETVRPEEPRANAGSASRSTPSSMTGGTGEVPPGGGVQQVATQRVFPSPLQPRKEFEPEPLQELAESIRANGILQPLLVRPAGERFELIAGERRWRAAQLAGLTQVPILVRVASDTEVLELALVENLQRENLNPIEEALGYQQLQSQFQLTQEQIARRVGRGRVVVANAMRLLKLTAQVQEWLRGGKLTVGHAKALLGLQDPKVQAEAAEQVIQRSLTVRQTEDLVARYLAPPKPPMSPPPSAVAPNPHVMDLENRLRERFATKVALRYVQGKGAVEIRFHNDEELHRVLQLLGLESE